MEKRGNKKSSKKSRRRVSQENNKHAKITIKNRHLPSTVDDQNENESIRVGGRL
jgi:hypothetical protein